MQNTKILPLIGLALVGAAITANHAFGRLPMATMRRLPVEQFPRAFAGWKGGADYPTDPEVVRKLPTAKIVNRDYRRADGRQVNLLLLTATEYADFHDPNWCFPAQGFRLSAVREITVAGQSARSMTAERDGAKLDVVYWWNGKVVTEVKWGREQIGKLLTLRNKLTNEQGQSLFVRLVTPAAPESGKLLREFAILAQPEMRKITSNAR